MTLIFYNRLPLNYQAILEFTKFFLFKHYFAHVFNTIVAMQYECIQQEVYYTLVSEILVSSLELHLYIQKWWGRYLIIALRKPYLVTTSLSYRKETMISQRLNDSSSRYRQWMWYSYWCNSDWNIRLNARRYWLPLVPGNWSASRWAN